jgi:hypothetical protein
VPSGTSREAQDLFIDRLAEMAPGERAVLANQLSADRHPGGKPRHVRP